MKLIVNTVMKIKVRRLNTLLFLSITLILSGCLGTTHQFRKGELLASGESEINWGYSQTEIPVCQREYYGEDSSDGKDSDGFTRCNGQWAYSDWYVFSRSFRLGVRDNWGPFTGVEIGYQIEIPHTTEFDIRLGLPHLFLGDNTKFRHAIGAGWGIGGWPDNTYFLDYAISYQKSEDITFYATFRESYLATQFIDTAMEDDPDEAGNLFKNAQRFYHQASIGMEYRFAEIYMFPDQLHLQYIVSAPILSQPGQPRPSSDFATFHPQLNIGLGWHY